MLGPTLIAISYRKHKTTPRTMLDHNPLGHHHLLLRSLRRLRFPSGQKLRERLSLGSVRRRRHPSQTRKRSITIQLSDLMTVKRSQSPISEPKHQSRRHLHEAPRRSRLTSQICLKTNLNLRGHTQLRRMILKARCRWFLTKNLNPSPCANGRVQMELPPK